MGMYSTFITQDIEIKNAEELKKISKEIDTLNLIDKDGNIQFDEWTDHKIEGYWYEGTMEILRAIAPFIEGFVEFEYEEGYRFKIIFRNGELFYQRTSNEWLDESPLNR